MTWTRSIALGLACTAALAACESSPSAPALEAPAVNEWSGAELSAAAAAADRQADSVPVLRRLLRHSLAKVKQEQGADAARALLANLAQLRQEARAAHEAGDRETVRAKLAAAHLEAARVVTQVLGTAPAQRATAALGTAVSKINERIAAAEGEGKNVERAKQFASHLATLHTQAAQALAAGNAASALDRATLGLEAIQRLQQRHRSR